MERRYDPCTSFHPVLHGGDVTVCPSRNIGTHRRIWRETTCARRGEARGGGTGGRKGIRCRRLTPRHWTNRQVLPGTPAANAINSCRARPRGAAVGWRDTPVCPVGVWCGALTSHPRPGRTHSCDPPSDSRTARSCTTTVACIRSRRPRQDPSVCPVPWC